MLSLVPYLTIQRKPDTLTLTAAATHHEMDANDLRFMNISLFSKLYLIIINDDRNILNLIVLDLLRCVCVCFFFFIIII